MTKKSLKKIEARIQAALDEDTLDNLALENNFVQRKRKIGPLVLYVALLTGFATRTVTTIADLLRGFNSLAERPVQYKPFHNQLVKDGFPAFTKAA